jgi:hypothetical protein
MKIISCKFDHISKGPLFVNELFLEAEFFSDQGITGVLLIEIEELLISP